MRRVLVALVLVASGLGACAGDERLSQAEFHTRMVAACQKVNQAIDDAQKGAPPDQAEAAAQFGTKVAGALQVFVSTAQALAPPKALEDDRDRFVKVIDAARSKFAQVPAAAADQRQPALTAAFQALGPAQGAAQPLGISPLEQCGEPTSAPAPTEGAPQVPVTATEYAFAVQGPVPAGKMAFVMTNQGRENHFLALVRLKDGVTSDQVIAAERQGQDTGPLIAAQVGSSNTAGPGGQGVLNAELTPGTYGIACFVAAPDGQPHAYKGMHATIQVS